MGVQKNASKTAKKASKLDSFKNLVFGGSSPLKKSKSPSGKSAPAKKSGQASKSAAAPKTSSAASKSVPHSKNQAVAKAPVKSASHKASGVEKSQTHSKSVPSASVKAVPPASTSKKKTSSHASVLPSSALVEGLAETVCREVACEGLATSGGYCRLHYIKNWKKIKRKEVILREKKLNQYIEELVTKYPDKYIEAIRQDLATDKDFAKVIYDLDLDEGVDDYDVESAESADSLIDTIKREFEDDGDAF
ncbi:MAG: hypothetical protein ACO3A2_01860 [Bdellovibrionia bacterium]